MTRVAIAVFCGGALMGGCAEDVGYVTAEESLVEPGGVRTLGAGCTVVSSGIESETAAGTAGGEEALPGPVALRIEGLGDGVRITASAGSHVVKREFDKSWLRVAGTPETLDVPIDDQRTYRVRLSGGIACN